MAAPAVAQECRLALVLALDVSASVDSSEHRLQREGLARALLAPEVMDAFLAGGQVFLHIFEWSAPSAQVAISPGWQLIDSRDDLVSLAGLLMVHSPTGSPHGRHSTAVGAALAYAAKELQGMEGCEARTVDISGDGENSDGFGPQVAYALYSFEGVTVNALAVGGTLDSRGHPQNAGDLIAWFRAEVLHGPGAFCMLADDYEDYERAMTEKLVRELEPPLVSGNVIGGNAG
jgi:hypothetical protein